MTKLPEPYIGAALDSLQIVITRAGVDKDSFLADDVLQDAVLMRLVDAGEHLARVRDIFADYYTEHASPDWDKLIGLRNIIAHGYGTIDFETVWLITQENLPNLARQLDKLV